MDIAQRTQNRVETNDRIDLDSRIRRTLFRSRDAPISDISQDMQNLDRKESFMKGA